MECVERPKHAGNHRYSANSETQSVDVGPLCIELPRDRDGSFDLQLVRKHETCFTGFGSKIIAVYAPSTDSPVVA